MIKEKNMKANMYMYLALAKFNVSSVNFLVKVSDDSELLNY